MSNLKSQIKEIIRSYQQLLAADITTLDERRIDLSAAYLCHLVEANQVMNLTGITEPQEMVILHLLDSWSVLPLIRELQPRHILDIGSGAGLPGIPLKICLPDIDFLLVDSLNKRINFLRQVVDRLNLRKIDAMHVRVEDAQFLNRYRETFDLSIARAVANLSTLLEYALPTVRLGGHFIAMKGPSVPEEIQDASRALDILGGKVVEDRVISLPEDAGERHILVIEKIKKTPARYPRAGGKPRKEPL